MIINFQINRLESKAWRNIEFNSVSVNHELNLKNPIILTEKSPFGDRSVLRIDYQLSVNYLNPNVGYMIFEGISDYSGEEDFTVVRDSWLNPDNVDVNKIKNEFASMILSNIIPFAMIMSSRLNLPSVVPIPQINFDSQKRENQEPQSYIG